MLIMLTRHSYSPTETMGVLQVGELELHTIERPWIPDEQHGSRPNESCVPDGEYRLVPHSSERFPDTWALVNPELKVFHYGGQAGRSAILFHVGNYVEDVIGCIAPGVARLIVRSRLMVTKSTEAMQELREALSGDDHRLIIKPTEGARL